MKTERNAFAEHESPHILSEGRRRVGAASLGGSLLEAGGTSLHPTLAQKVTNLEVLRILLSIGPSETKHFETWQDKAGNALPITDTGVGFPRVDRRDRFLRRPQRGPRRNQPRVSCHFLDPTLGPVAITQPSSAAQWRL
jgi:hypothetical protein